MKKINYNNMRRAVNIVIAVTAIYIMVFSLFHGCMETIQPADESNRLIKAAAFKIVDPVSGEMKPMRGVEITIFEDKKDKLNELKKSVTNENGIAGFEMGVPVIGKIYSLKATYGPETQTKSSLLICKDTTINFIFGDDLLPVDCSNLNLSDTLTILDNDGSKRLKKNTPENINRYEKCETIVVPSNSSGAITFKLPAIAAPFTLASIIADDEAVPLATKTIVVKPGGTLTLCFSVSTTTPGQFSQGFPIAASCEDGATGTINLTLKAEVVEPSCDCEDIKNSETVVLDKRVTVGESYEFKDMEVFVNNTACTVVITQPGAGLTNGWTITSPTFPVTLAKGEAMSVSGKFAPVKSGKTLDTLQLSVKPQGTTNDCPLDIYFEANGCYNSCPLIGFKDRLNPDVFGKNSPYTDNITNRSDDKVFISVPGLESTAFKTYYLEVPDSACGEADITVELVALDKDKYAEEFFKLESPGKMTLLPGETGQVELSFKAPDLAKLNEILKARKGAGPYTQEDSTFKIRIRLRGNNCTQDIDLKALITAFPDISPIINLRAFDQKTPQKPFPENEVYYFGYGSRTIIKNADGSNPTPPPTLGNIWIDVNDNNQTANPPQEPILKLVDNSIEIKLWQRNYPESKFSDIPVLLKDFAVPGYNTGYGPGPITGISVNDVYAIKFDELTYALMFIRRVDDGTENTSSKQSGIEFRAVYPIYIY